MCDVISDEIKSQNGPIASAAEELKEALQKVSLVQIVRVPLIITTKRQIKVTLIR